MYDRHGAVAPRTLYGVYKLANEGTGRVYWQEDGVASVGLRPFSVYGPGRDQGITAGPTLAIDAAVRGEPYRIAFGGRTQLHYAADVARAFVQAARSPANGAHALSLGGPPTAIADFVTAVEAEMPGSGDHVRRGAVAFPGRAAGAVVRRAAHPARARDSRDRRGLARRHIVALQQPKEG